MLIGLFVLLMVQDLTSENAFASMEKALLALDGKQLDVKVISSGAVQSEFEGHIRNAQNNQLHMKFDGHFMNQTKKILITSDGSKYKYGDKQAETTPSDLNRGVYVGLTHMGVLHNLAMLSMGHPPDYTHGKVHDILQAKDVELMGLDDSHGEPAHKVRFKLIVKGVESAEATLWISKKTHLPLRREQTVHFEQGDMSVVETYKLSEVTSKQFQLN
jgi:hypothetical protein